MTKYTRTLLVHVSPHARHVHDMPNVYLFDSEPMSRHVLLMGD